MLYLSYFIILYHIISYYIISYYVNYVYDYVILCYILLSYRAGKLDYKIALSTTKYLNKEKNYVVWRVALSNLNYMKKILSNRPSYSLFKVGIK